MWHKDLIHRFEHIETPFYLYDTDVLDEVLTEAKKWSQKYAFKVHYAVKANANPRLMRLIKKHGFGADCVSGNEVRHSIAMGFKPWEVVFAGVGKTDKEIEYALDAGVFSLNVESMQELEVVDEIARKKRMIAPISVRINPNFAAETHDYITTGLEDNKFGIAYSNIHKVAELIKQLKHIKFIGVHVHIGSQISKLEVFKGLCAKVNQIQDDFQSNGLEVEHLNLGGGLGINYEEEGRPSVPDFKSYFETFNKYLNIQSGQQVHFELGRSLVASCGNLVSRVLYIKNGGTTNFAVIDAGMTELIRPALYRSVHKIENISAEHGKEQYSVVGPICETSDTFGKQVELPETKRGDFIVIRSTGAYGEVMASQYNMRTPAKSYYSDELR